LNHVILLGLSAIAVCW